MTTHQDATADEPVSVRTEEDLILAAIRQESHPRISRAGTFPTPGQIGPYTIVRELGAGGMGIVYEARQEKPLRRTVALKVIKRGMDTRAVVSRFEAERQALALLDHPNIAHIFEAGSTEEGKPYFSMELVHGVHITKFCDEHRLRIPERLALFVQACDAIQHAHQKGIIHRDIKPSNVLVDQSGDEPILKIIDFGIAKATDHRLSHETIMTEHGLLFGTPEYMSPEHARMTGRDMDTRTDVYSLGVLLYELLLGTLPHGRTHLLTQGFSDICRVICEETPPRPSARLLALGPDATRVANRRGADPKSLRRRIRGDLDWITMKALEKDRDQRYASVTDLAADIHRHTTNEPVIAGPPSTLYRAKKFVRRNRMLVGGAAAFAMLLILSLVVIGSLLWRSKEDRRSERRQAYLSNIAEAQLHLSHREIGAVHRQLDRAPPELRGWEWHFLRAESDHSLWVLRGHEGPVWSVDYSPDGSRLASASEDGRIAIWDVATGEILNDLRGHDGIVYEVDWDATGTRLASVSEDKSVRVWNTENGDLPLVMEGHPAAVYSVDLSPDGSLVAAGLHQGGIRIWDAVTGEAIPTKFPGQRSTVFDLTLSPDGTHLAAALHDHVVYIWDVVTADEVAAFPGHTKIVRALDFSPDGTLLASGSFDTTIRIWSVRTGEVVRTLRGHPKCIQSVEFSPDGRLLASAGDDNTVRIWDAAQGTQLAELHGHAGVVQSISFSPDGRFIASACRDDRSVRIWDAHAGGQLGVPWGYKLDVMGAAISLDGSRLAYTPDDGKTVHVLEALSGDVVSALRVPWSPMQRMTLNFDGTRLAAGSSDGTVQILDTSTEGQLLTIREGSGGVRFLAFSPDGRRLVVAWTDQTFSIVDARTGKEIARFGSASGTVISAAMSPDNAIVAVVTDRNATPTVWDVVTRRCLSKLVGHDDRVTGVSFSRDGSIIATTSYDRTVRLWDARAGEELACFRGHEDYVSRVTFGSENERLASASADGTVRIWDVSSGDELLVLRGHKDGARTLAFSEDGTRLIALARDGAVRIWDSVPYRDRYHERQTVFASRADGHEQAKR